MRLDGNVMTSSGITQSKNQHTYHHFSYSQGDGIFQPTYTYNIVNVIMGVKIYFQGGAGVGHEYISPTPVICRDRTPFCPGGGYMQRQNPVLSGERLYAGTEQGSVPTMVAYTQLPAYISSTTFASFSIADI